MPTIQTVDDLVSCLLHAVCLTVHPAFSGRLDIVAARDDTTLSAIDVIHPGVSEHQLLRWTASLLLRLISH